MARNYYVNNATNNNTPSCIVDIFTDTTVTTTLGGGTVHTWYKRPGLSYVEVICIGGGGSGGTGLLDVPGAGGGGGGYSRGIILANDLPSSVMLRSGHGGAAGNPAFGQNTGFRGGRSEFGSFVKAGGGTNGASQLAFPTRPAGGAGGLNNGCSAWGNNSTVQGDLSMPNYAPGAGGIGGTSTFSAGSGGTNPVAFSITLTGSTAGVTNSKNGKDGYSDISLINFIGGGGGGGAYGLNTQAGTGGNGGLFGGGGGGGGAFASTGSSASLGSIGGAGVVVVFNFF